MSHGADWRRMVAGLQALRDIADIAVERGGRRTAFATTARWRSPGSASGRAIQVFDAADGRTRTVSDAGTAARLPRWLDRTGALAFVEDGEEDCRVVVRGQDGSHVRTPALPGSVEDLCGGPAPGELLALLVEPSAAPELPPRRGLVRIDAASAQVEHIDHAAAVWELDCRRGQPVAVLASADHTAEGWYGASLRLLDPSTGDEREVHRPTEAVTVPRLSPDGRSLAFVEGYVTDRGQVRGRVRVVDLDSGEQRTLAPLLEDVCWLAWTEAGPLYAAGWNGMDAYLVEIAGDEVSRTLWHGPGRIGRVNLAWAALAPDGAAAAVAAQAPGRPPELELLRLDGGSDGGWRRVTRINDELDVSSPERIELRWTAPDGTEIEGAALLPAATDAGPHPLVVVVHGGPTALFTREFAPLASALSFPLVLAAAGFAVLMPNPRGSSGYGQAFSRALIRDVGGGELEDILAGVDACCRRGIADPRRVGIMGNSWGGFMSAWAIGRSDRFRAAVPMASICDWTTLHYTGAAGRGSCQALFSATPSEDPDVYVRSSPIAHLHSGSAPALVVHGACDAGVPSAQALLLHAALLRLGVHSELAHYPGEGHSIQRPEHQLDLAERIVTWFGRHLGEAGG